jgi:hypothetical protein
MLKSIVEFLGLGAVIDWLRPRVKRDNINTTATVVLALATIALFSVAILHGGHSKKLTSPFAINNARSFLSLPF